MSSRSVLPSDAKRENKLPNTRFKLLHRTIQNGSCQEGAVVGEMTMQVDKEKRSFVSNVHEAKAPVEIHLISLFELSPEGKNEVKL